jgi:superfamily II DNA or RNA helicase
MTEIVYCIDAEESTRYKCLALKLIEVEKEQSTYVFPKHESTLTIARLSSFRAEQDLIQLLMKEELNFQREKMGRASQIDFALIHVSAMQSISVLTTIGSFQKLFFNQKQLVVDLFGKVEFYYQVNKLNALQTQVTGRLKWRDQDVAIHECDCVGMGRPHWFIRGITLKLIATPLHWNALQHAYQHASWILEGIQQTEFFNEIDEKDCEAPKIIGATLEEIKCELNPFPVLVLKDRMGAFADLWMEYGPNRRIAFHENSPILKKLGKRNLEAEKCWEKDLLETDFVRKMMNSSHYYCPIDKIAKSLAFLLEIGWTIDDWKGNRVIHSQSAHIKMDRVQSFIQIKGTLHYDTYTADLTEVMGAFNRRETFISLSNGAVGLLSFERDWQELAEEGEILGQEVRVDQNRLGMLSSFFEKAELTPTLQDWQNRLKDFTQIREALPGPAFQGRLRAYQQQGLNWLSFLAEYEFHGLLADDMGLGKTIQILALLSRLPHDRPHLIVLPTSLLFNWKKEIETFLPSWTPYLHQGPQRTKSSEKWLHYPIILTSYTTLRLDLPLFQSCSYGCLILDEAQTIKNAHTQTAQAVCTLQARLRLSLTGTPIENHLHEIGSHFHFLIPGLLEDEQSFRADLQAAESDQRYLKKIKKKMAPFILRRKKEEVAKDLPQRIEQIVYVSMSETQRAIYERFLAGIKSNLIKKVEAGGIKKHRLEVLEAILRLRQICCHPMLISSLLDEQDRLESAKWEAVSQDLETVIEEGHKVLIYSQFTTMLKWMAEQARQKSWTYAYLDGQTVNRQAEVEKFQEDPTTHLFFISLKAGGVGLNLTAADDVWIYDPWWNDAVEEQAISRAHRIGREGSVLAKRFVMVESIEEKMMRLKSTKRRLMDDILESDSLSHQFSIEDLVELLS